MLQLVEWPIHFYRSMNSDADCMYGIFVGLLEALYVAIFRSRFDCVAAQNIDAPSNVDEFDFAAALVRAEPATNIAVRHVDCTMIEVTTMMAFPRTTFGYENSIERSEMKKKMQIKMRKTFALYFQIHYYLFKSLLRAIGRTTSQHVQLRSHFPCQMSGITKN